MQMQASTGSWVGCHAQSPGHVQRAGQGGGASCCSRHRAAPTGTGSPQLPAELRKEASCRAGLLVGAGTKVHANANTKY